MQIRTLILLIFTLVSCKESTNTDIPKHTNKVDYSALTTVLDRIYVEDQKYRGEIDSINQAHGWDSDEMRNHWQKINKADSNNLLIVKQILDKHGWLSSDQIGNIANYALFLVIQHADQETQEQYLPIMRMAVKEGNARGENLAMLEDRVRIGRGELQVYGSQVSTNYETGETFVLPLMEPETVNERRAEMGLGTIEDYVSNWDSDWDVEEYKKNLPKYIEMTKPVSRE